LLLFLCLTCLSVGGWVAARWLGDRPYAPLPDPAPAGWSESAIALPIATVGDVAGTLVPAPSALASVLADAAASAVPAVDEPEANPLAHPVLPALDTENVLLIGLDRHGAYKRGGSTDTLVIAAFDRHSDHVGLISVPRDLYVWVEGHGQARINAVYGLARASRQDPLMALQRVIEDTLGLPIAHSLAIDLQVFESAVDAVGGVVVDVDCAIDDNFIDSRVEGARRVLSLDAGPQFMDGATAGMFVRSRHGRSDFARARRQQAVLLALRRKLGSMDGVAQFPALLEGVEGSIETHMSRLQLIQLTRRAVRVAPGHLHGVVLGHREMTGHRTADNRSVLLPDSDAIAQTLSTLFSAPKPGTALPGSPCVARDAALQHRGR
jgi:LCP family protein required for cell wall assembly